MNYPLVRSGRKEIQRETSKGESTWRESVLLSVIDYDDMRRALVVEEARWTLGQHRVKGVLLREAKARERGWRGSGVKTLNKTRFAVFGWFRVRSRDREDKEKSKNQKLNSNQIASRRRGVER
jgi:hypothetical protein